MRCLFKKLVFVGLMSAISVAAWSNEGARADESFYKGKTVNIVVGYAPGGGYDIYSRLLARHLAKHIDAHPNVIVQNMPGAASVVAANYVYSVAPRDGTVIAAIDQNAPMFNLLGGKGTQYDITKVAWLGSMAASNGIAMAWAGSGIKTLHDVMEHEVSIGTTGSNDDAYVYAKSLNYLIGTQFKIIQGYSGTSSVNIAMENGEVQTMGRSSYYGFVSQRADWLRDKKVNILVQIGLQPQAELTNIPLLLDLVKGEENQQLARLVSTPPTIGYSHWLSPDVAKDRIAIMQDAYNKTLADDELLAEAKQLAIEIKPKSAQTIADIISSSAAVSMDIRSKAGALLGWN